MRNHLIATLLLMAGIPVCGTMSASAEPVPQVQGQAAERITGTVLDENNEPVIGASIVQKGNRQNAALTDVDGNFSIKVRPGTMLEISYVGYKTVSIAASQGLMVYLEPTTEQLNELVAIGYGTQKRANLTGAVATVDVARTMDSRPQQDVMQALQGAVPGLTILNSNGNIDGTPSIKIRGTGTLSNKATSSPLFIVDGVSMDDISYLNPDDIKEISVLKDASSSSIYGSRAAFGVVLITTKEGVKSDRVQIKYTNNFGWSQATFTPETNDIVTSLEAMLQASKQLGADQGEFFGIYYTDILPYARKWMQQNSGKIKTYGEVRRYKDENNIGDYFLTDAGTQYLPYADFDLGAIYYNNAAPSNQHNVSLSGSSGRVTYNTSFGYAKRQSLLNFNPDKIHRYNAKVDLKIDVTKWLTAGVRMSYSQRNVETVNFNLNSWGQIWRFPGFFQMPGTMADAEGNQVGFYNVATDLQNAGNIDNRRTYSRMQAYARAEIIKGLSLNADFTYARTTSDTEYAYLPYKSWYNWGRTMVNPTYRVTPANSTATNNNSHSERWTLNVYGTYDFTVAKNNNFKIMLGSNVEQNQYKYFQARTKGLLDVDLPVLNLYTGDLVAPSYDASHWATSGFFGRINYDYKGIWLLEFNGRYDGSSRFPEHDQWAFFPSGSAGYRFSEESYFEPLKKWWSNAKLRASYGEIGNEAIGNNMFISTISTGTFYYVDHATGTLMNAANMPTLVSSALTWERIRTLDLGLDFGFFDNQLTGSFDWYQRDTKDMLAPGQTLPDVLGAKAPYTNAGSLRTRGWELALGWNRSFGDWDVYANFTIADAKTTVTDWQNSTRSLNDYYSGSEYGAIWGLETARYYTVDDFEKNADGTFAKDANGAFIPKKGVVDQRGIESGSFHFGPGDVMYVDQDGDGVISGGEGTADNHGDVIKIGNSLPRFEYGIRLGGAWKGIDLGIFLQGVGKRDYWTVSSMVIPFTQAPNDIFYSGMESHNNIVFDDAWNIVGYEVDQSNKYPNLYPGCYGNNNVSGISDAGNWNFIPQTRYLQDLSYLRVKNLTVGYTLPDYITKKAYIQKFRVYFSGENLFFLHRGNKGIYLDPEITSTEWSGANTWGRTNPIQRTYSFGFQITL